jgi:hypothetical protein
MNEEGYRNNAENMTVCPNYGNAMLGVVLELSLKIFPNFKKSIRF